MEKKLSFAGVFPILVTPFDERDEIDLASFARMVRFMGEIGVDLVSSYGESAQAPLSWISKCSICIGGKASIWVKKVLLSECYYKILKRLSPRPRSMKR